jgi:peptidoglycan/xylan/chitin deacetylase (PgdA/CDA1 family)
MTPDRPMDTTLPAEERPRWPGGARCAVMLSFDVDGPSSWINRDPATWRLPKTFSLGAYGPWRALPRILDLLETHDLPGTFFVPGWVAEAWPERFAAIAGAGHELGHHGYMHELYYDMPLERQREVIERSQAIFEDLAGAPATGFRTPSGDLRRETPALLRELGFSYSSSMRGDDRPYRWEIDGRPSDLIEIPAHWELDDFPQFGFNFNPPMPRSQDRIAGTTATFDNFRREFDGYYRFGLCYVLMLHPQVIGKPGRLRALDRLLAHIRSHPDVWFARGHEIAEWWRSQTAAGTAGVGTAEVVA